MVIIGLIQMGMLLNAFKNDVLSYRIGSFYLYGGAVNGIIKDNRFDS